MSLALALSFSSSSWAKEETEAHNVDIQMLSLMDKWNNKGVAVTHHYEGCCKQLSHKRHTKSECIRAS